MEQLYHNNNNNEVLGRVNLILRLFYPEITVCFPPLYYLYFTIGENINGAPKMRNNYGAPI